MKRLLAIFISLSAIFSLAGCERSGSSDISLTDTFVETDNEADNAESPAADTAFAKTDITTSKEAENAPINFENNAYQLIGA